jgi:hypothetical protein
MEWVNKDDVGAPNEMPTLREVEVQADIHAASCMERPVLLTSALLNHGDLIATRES